MILGGVEDGCANGGALGRVYGEAAGVLWVYEDLDGIRVQCGSQGWENKLHTCSYPALKMEVRTMKLLELLLSPTHTIPRDGPAETNPLVEDGLLDEAQLLDVRSDAITQTGGLIFDLRSALEFTRSNTAVIVARGVRNFFWSGPPGATTLTAWSVASWSLSSGQAMINIENSLWPAPGGLIHLAAERTEFYSGDAADLDGGLDYEGLQRIQLTGAIPDWGSCFEVADAFTRGPVD